MAAENEKALNHMRLEFLSLPENVGLARVAVASFVAQLDLTLNDLEELKVAISEAVSNSMIHGYQGKTSGVITVTAARYEDRLEIIVEDNGKGISDVQLATQPAYSTDPERMGLGFVFMNTFMDSVRVESEPNKGTRVIMTKKLDNLGIPAAKN